MVVSGLLKMAGECTKRARTSLLDLRNVPASVRSVGEEASKSDAPITTSQWRSPRVSGASCCHIAPLSRRQPVSRSSSPFLLGTFIPADRHDACVRTAAP
jgi:hypothetical protein